MPAGQGAFPLPLERAGNLALPGGALFLWRNRGKNTKGKEVPSPWNPILWWEKRGKVVPSGRGLACGLKDQRLMARPPARAGGRSGLLTGGESGKPNGSLCLLPKGTYPRPQPAQPVGGPLRASNVRAAGQVSCKKYSLPHTTPPEKGSGGGTSSRGFFPHFFPRNGAPAGQAKVPARSNGVEKTLNASQPPTPYSRASARNFGSAR